MDSVATHIVLTLRQRIISHGCGYCSGEDNEAFVRVFNVTVPVPSTHIFKLGQILDESDWKMFDISQWCAIPKEVEYTGSGYCNGCDYWSDVGSRHDDVTDIVCAVAIDEDLNKLMRI